jgi:hypothetical protein
MRIEGSLEVSSRHTSGGLSYELGQRENKNPYMKLHHLLQKCSFFLIKLAAVQASGCARMKLLQNGAVS